jgi:two-component system sensor histidine kinase ChvG
MSTKLTGGATKGFFVNGHDLAPRPGHHQPGAERLLLRAGEGWPVDIRLSMEPRHVVVRVEDNGPGIRTENIENIFERFYTDRPGPDQFGKNSGLGLSISRQIVEAHGGTLTAENIPAPQGRSGPQEAQWAGARFIIDLPAEGL